MKLRPRLLLSLSRSPTGPATRNPNAPLRLASASFDAHASGFVATGSLPCVEMGSFYDGYGEPEPDDGDDAGDWGEEEEPTSSDDPEEIPPDMPDMPDTGEWDERDEYYYGDQYDIWGITLRAGEVIYVSVDVTDAENMSDPMFMVTGPDYCLTATGYNELGCSEDIRDSDSCPAAEFLPDESGQHYIIVHVNECSTENAPYQVGVDADTDPDLTLLADDTDLYVMESLQYQVTGSAIVSD